MGQERGRMGAVACVVDAAKSVLNAADQGAVSKIKDAAAIMTGTRRDQIAGAADQDDHRNGQIDPNAPTHAADGMVAELQVS